MVPAPDDPHGPVRGRHGHRLLAVRPLDVEARAPGRGEREDDERELQDGMRKLGIDLTRNETRSLMDRFQHSSRRGVIMYRDFVKALKIPRRVSRGRKVSPDG